METSAESDTSGTSYIDIPWRSELSSPAILHNCLPNSRRDRTKELTRRAEVSLSSEGFYEVAVHYDHCESIARGCGVTTEAVSQALLDDNAHRRSMELSEGDPDP